MKVVFLDYDGVVNTIVWDDEGKKANFAYPHQGKVNDFQAVQWVSEFCEKFGYQIVVTSTWRLHDNWAMCLSAGGLRKTVKIYDRLPIDRESRNKSRSELINEYLKNHPNIDQFLIFDDDKVEGQIMGVPGKFYGENSLEALLVKCPSATGFKYEEYHKAKALHEIIEIDISKHNELNNI